MEFKRKILIALVVIILASLASACHKAPPVAPTPVAAAPSATPPPGPPTCDLTPSPTTVELGQAVTLSWTSEDAVTLTLNPGLGEVQAKGSTSVTPSAPTTYSLTLQGPGGAGECEARVTVTPPSTTAPSISESNIGAGGAAGAPGAAAANALQDAFFDFATSTLRPDAVKALTQDADYLKAHPDMKIQIGGYCDQRGSEEYNLGLGERRAEAAQTFLVNMGVPADNITTISYGKDRLFCTEATETCYQSNRRDHVLIQGQAQ